MYPHHINDHEFANALVDSFLEISTKSSIRSPPSQVSIPESNQQTHESSVSKMNLSSSGAILRNLIDFPDARPGWSLYHIHFLCDIINHQEL